MTSVSITQPKKQKQVRHTCTYQGSRGILTADALGCAFNTEMLKAEFPWSSVKWIRVTTKYVKDMPTSVLAIKTIRAKGLSTRLFSSGKHYFYHFMDIVEAAKQLQELQDDASASGVTARNILFSDTILSSNENTKSTVVVPSLNSVTNATRGGQAPNDSGNNNHNDTTTSLHLGTKRKTPEDDDSHVGSQLDDDAVSSSSTWHIKKMKQTRGDAEDENNGRNKSANEGDGKVSLIKVPRRHELKESDSKMFLLRRRFRIPNAVRKSHWKRRGVENSLWQSCHNLGWSTITNIPCRIVGILGVTLLVVLLLLFGGAGVGLMRNSPSDDAVTSVIRGLEQMQQWNMERHKLGFESDKQHDSPLMMKTLPTPPAHVTLREMTIAVKELLGRYVRLQQDLVFIRLHRMRRMYGVFESNFNTQHHHLFDGGFSDSSSKVEEQGETLGGKKNWFSWTGHPKTPRGTLATRIVSGVRSLWHYIYEAFATVRWIFRRHSRSNRESENFRKSDEGAAATATKKDQLTRYTEVLTNGQIVSEDVSAEESRDRRICLRLTRELVRLSQLMERIFHEYQDIVMAPLYESYLHQMSSSGVGGYETSGSVRLGVDVDPTMRILDEGNGVWTGQNTHLLRSILLRRHTVALLQLEPLLYSEGEQFQKSVWEENEHQFASSHRSYNATDGGTKASLRLEPTRENVEAILQDFVASTTHNRSASKNRGRHWSILRNILPEVRYWREHEEEWQTIVLWRLNTSARERDAGKTSENVLQEDDDVRNAIASLPLFRGQWCFLEQPIELPLTKKNMKESQVVGADVTTASSYTTTSLVNAQQVSGPLVAIEGQGAVGGLYGCGEFCTKNNTTFEATSNVDGPQKECMSSSKFEQGPHRAALIVADILQTPNSVSEPVKTTLQLEEEEKEKEKETEMREYEEMVSEETIDIGIRAYELMSHKVHIQWLNAFDLFLRAHGDWHDQFCSKRGLWKRAISYPTDNEEGNNGKGISFMRQRFLQLLVWSERQYGRYLSRDGTTFVGGLSAFPEFTRRCPECGVKSWWTFLWPLSWFTAPNKMHPLRCWLWQMSVSDPAISKLYRDVLQTPLGEMEDLPWMLLSFLSTPSELLKTHYDAHVAFCAACWLLFLTVMMFMAMTIFLKSNLGL